MYVLLVAVGLGISVYLAAGYMTGRASASTALAGTSRTLAEQVSVLCSPQSERTGSCVYVGADGDFDETRFPSGSCFELPVSGGLWWVCRWSDEDSFFEAPEHVGGTLATLADRSVDVRSVHLEVSSPQRRVTVRVSGCAGRWWLPAVRWCGTEERSHHL